MNSRRTRYRSLIAPKESMLLIVDGLGDQTVGDQPVEEERLAELVNLVKAARECSIPVVMAARESGGSAGTLHAALGKLVRPSEVIKCGGANPWDDDDFSAVVRGTKRSRLLVAGRFTETCVTFAALSALEDGFDVYVVTDATYGASKEHHKTAISRMAQAGAVPVTTRQIIFEWQRRSSTKSEEPDAPGS